MFLMPVWVFHFVTFALFCGQSIHLAAAFERTVEREFIGEF